MELSTRYNPADTEQRWYAHWESRGYFRSVPDGRQPFTIVIPPPNVTGVLHMGHMLNNTIQDILIRKARLDGKNACWVPGTDHASIATEAKVVRWLREEKKLRKADLSRAEFMEYAYQWKDKYGGIILQQLRSLGASCDWERTAFTMDKGYYADCIRVFCDLYRKDKLYRGLRMVNWDPEAKTVLSNEEVLYNEENAQLFHIRYRLADAPRDAESGIVIATQRPETIFADVAIAVNPKDSRYTDIVGKKVLIPLINRAIPVIADDYVDIEFGTGALKITPAHDPNDYEVGQRHGLEVIDTISDDGKINASCTYAPIVGMDRFEARKAMKPALEASGDLVKIQDYRTNIGRSERTGAVVEPKLSLQWFVKMSSLGEPALRAVLDEEVKFYPPHFQNLYRNWMENLRDWCISRQLWWGQQIPAWYGPAKPGSEDKEAIFVAETPEAALAQAQAYYADPHLTLADLRQDEDVLDTWASSWLWPISVFNGFQDPGGEINYYYPTQVLVTGWDIIFFWVARMIMAGYEFRGQRPFEAVYFTGMVRDKQRRKMSKSLGNSPDAVKLLEDFGADGVRYGLMSSAAAGGDILFDEKLCENGRNFCNKLWNALRLVKGWAVAEAAESQEVQRKNALAVRWLQEKFQQVLADVERDFQAFRLSEALLGLYGFIWDDFCSWYLEMIKPGFEQPIDRATQEATLAMYGQLMVVLHPFMPFITEEIWHQLALRAEGQDCCRQAYPMAAVAADGRLVQQVELAKGIITAIREVRNQNKLKPREPLTVQVQASDSARDLFAREGLREMVMKMAVLDSLELSDAEPANAKSFIIGTEKYYVVLEQQIDVEAERKKMSNELDYQRGFVRSVEAKLANERFVSGAPAAVVEAERKKLADGLARIAILEESLGRL
ncbi:MAG TPA: valine--tRNA ligase [Saprospiraceae bacterium]|nr:valine--tRNA ligase [Saprospiraceae bacterium]